MLNTSHSKQEVGLPRIATAIQSGTAGWGNYKQAVMILESNGAPAHLICKVSELGVRDFIFGRIMGSDDFTEQWHRVGKVYPLAPEKWSDYLTQGILPEVVRDVMVLYEKTIIALEQWTLVSQYYDFIGDATKAEEFGKKSGPELGTSNPDLSEYWQAVNAFRAKYTTLPPNQDCIEALRASLPQEIREVQKLMDNKKAH